MHRRWWLRALLGASAALVVACEGGGDDHSPDASEDAELDAGSDAGDDSGLTQFYLANETSLSLFVRYDREGEDFYKGPFSTGTSHFATGPYGQPPSRTFDFLNVEDSDGDVVLEQDPVDDALWEEQQVGRDLEFTLRITSPDGTSAQAE